MFLGRGLRAVLDQIASLNKIFRLLMAPDVLATPFPVTCAHGPLPQLAFAFWGAMYPKPKPVGHTSILRLQKSIFSPPESKTYPHLELCKNKIACRDEAGMVICAA